VVALVVAFAGLARWQYLRATGGNSLSWAYALEWPLFAGFVVAMWVRAVRDELREAGGGARPQPPPIARPALRPPVGAGQPAVPGQPADDDPDVAAYNRYLAWLAADPDRRPGDYQDEAP
jgi:hypothetical protein